MAHWDNQARRWEYISAPLKPSQVDIQNHTQWIDEYSMTVMRPLRVLVLGVTPEIVGIQWPDDTQLFAVDNNMAMIQHILPTAKANLTPIAIAANWLELPFEKQSIDIVIGDGCYSSLAAKDYVTLSQQITRVLKDAGIMIMRFFLQTESNSPTSALWEDLCNNNISNFSEFKLKLAMKIQAQLDTGVCLKDIWEYYNEHFRQKMLNVCAKLNWSIEEINTIDNYKNNEVLYTFPKLSEISHHLKSIFDFQKSFTPNYAMGDQCISLQLSGKTSLS